MDIPSLPGREIIVDNRQIQQRVRELGRQITQDYHGRSLVLLGVLDGA